jgi:hypothetical protein
VTIAQQLEQYRQDALYFERHRADLLAQHPDRWVAVYGGVVVATDRSLPRLLKRLDAKGLPRGQVFIEYLATHEDVLILPTT